MLRLLLCDILLELVEQSRELSLEIVVDLAQIVYFVAQIIPLLLERLGVNFKRVARRLEVAYFTRFGFLKVLELINKTLSELCGLDLVLKHDLLLNLIGND